MGIISTIIGMRSPRYLLYRIFELLIGYPLYAISFIVPRNKNKWVFGTNVSFNDNAKYLFIYTTEQNDGIRPIWIARSKADRDRIRKSGFTSYLKYSLPGLFHSLTADKYIYTYHSSDINFFTSGRAKKINLWHGVGIKGGTGGRNSKATSFKTSQSFLTRFLMPYYWEKDSLFLSTSTLMNKHFQGMFDLKDETIYNSIYPRCYYMCKTNDEIESFIGKYESIEMQDLVKKLVAYDKVYLYMPTWRGNLNDDFISQADFNFEEMNRRMKDLNRLFIFKLHPAVKISRNLIKETYSNILFLDKSLDIYPILPFTSTLITDYSSIYYDYILLNKEIILYPFDKAEYIDQSNDLAFDFDTYTPGHRVFNSKQLMECISSDRQFHVKEKDWIIEQFWGKTDKNDLGTFYNAIKSL